LVATALSNEASVQESDYAEEITATTARFVEEDRAAKIKELEDDKWGTKGINAWSGKNNKAAKDVLAQYAAAAGLGELELTDISGTDKNRKFKYKDADGNEHEVSLD
jgi:hypothetical protein